MPLGRSEWPTPWPPLLTYTAAHVGSLKQTPILYSPLQLNQHHSHLNMRKNATSMLSMYVQFTNTNN